MIVRLALLGEYCTSTIVCPGNSGTTVMSGGGADILVSREDSKVTRVVRLGPSNCHDAAEVSGRSQHIQIRCEADSLPFPRWATV
jgi:hypothetical protein